MKEEGKEREGGKREIGREDKERNGRKRKERGEEEMGEARAVIQATKVCGPKEAYMYLSEVQL